MNRKDNPPMPNPLPEKFDKIAKLFIEMPCDCGHTLADHAPTDAKATDEPCDLCECIQFQAVDPDRKCDMCGAPFHRDPAQDPDEFGLVCPGADATTHDTDEYIYSRDLAEAEQRKIKESPAAQRAYAERVRSDVSIDVLQANCQEVTNVVSPVIQARTLLDSDGPEIEPPHLTLKGHLTPGRGIDVTPIANSEDYSMYLEGDQ